METNGVYLSPLFCFFDWKCMYQLYVSRLFQMHSEIFVVEVGDAANTVKSSLRETSNV